MRRSILVAVLMLTVLLLTLACAEPETREKGTELSDQLRLTVKALKTTVEAGEPVLLSISLTNTSTSAVNIEYYRYGYKDYRVTVANADHREAAPTAFFRQLKKDLAIDSDSFRSYRLEPGRSTGCTLNAGVLADMTLPGKYYITVRRGLPLPVSREALVSNTVEINVTLPSATSTVSQSEQQ